MGVPPKPQARFARVRLSSVVFERSEPGGLGGTPIKEVHRVNSQKPVATIVIGIYT
jgi:hypothetical protein